MKNIAFNLIHNEKNLKIITTTEKSINLAESFLDLNKKLKEKFTQILNDKTECISNMINKNSHLDNSIKVEISDDLTKYTTGDGEKLNQNEEIHELNKNNFLGKKTNREQLIEKANDKNYEKNNLQENLILDKFVLTQNKGTISEYESKSSKNFYLFINPNTEKYLLNKNIKYNCLKKDGTNDHFIKSNSETQDKISFEESKNFSLKFDSKQTYMDDNNLNINQIDDKNSNFDMSREDDNDEISIPDII